MVELAALSPTCTYADNPVDPAVQGVDSKLRSTFNRGRDKVNFCPVKCCSVVDLYTHLLPMSNYA